MFDAVLTRSILKLLWKIFKKKWLLKVKTVRGVDDKLLIFMENWPQASFFILKLCEGNSLTDKLQFVCGVRNLLLFLKAFFFENFVALIGLVS